MTQKTQYYPLFGGLDAVTPAIATRPGTARAAKNYESTMTGYRRLLGYERYDGRTSPTDAYTLAISEVQGALDREAARTAITTVPGSGPIRGVWYYNNKLYAFRDTAAGTAGAMYASSSTGWQLVSNAFPPGGRYEFVNYNFYGAASSVRMYGVNGVGKGFQYDGTTLTFITTGMSPDTPTKVEAHKHYLFFAFPGGSLQYSNVGEPLTWAANTGAGEIALGDEITGLQSAAPANLVVMSKNSVSLLYGSVGDIGSIAGDFQLETITNEAGALEHTVEKIGPVVYMDNRGVRALTTTPAFGNFSIGTMTQSVAPLLRGKMAGGERPVASARVRARDTYRVFFGNGTGFSIFMGKKAPEVMPIDLNKVVTCCVSTETEANYERIWFGSDNGYVYEMDKGRSFDGGAVSYYLRLPFAHMGAPHVRKRWHKVVIEYDAPAGVTIGVAGEVDYGDQYEPSLASQEVDAHGGGGFWDNINWDQFFWSAPAESKAEVYVDAVGENMSLVLGGEQADEEPHVLEGVTLFYSVRGLVR